MDDCELSIESPRVTPHLARSYSGVCLYESPVSFTSNRLTPWHRWSDGVEVEVPTVTAMTTKQQNDLRAYAQELIAQGNAEAAKVLMSLLG